MKGFFGGIRSMFGGHSHDHGHDHSHDHGHSHGHSHDHDHDHDHDDDDHECDHDHDHDHDHEHGDECDHDHDHDHGDHEHGDDCDHDHEHEHEHEQGKACDHDHGKDHTHEHGDNKTCTKSESSKVACTAEEAAKSFVYFQKLDEIEESQLVKITPDVNVLRAKWKEAGLGENDELGAFCGEIGKVVEVEASDDTLQVQWENYDTCWVPALACGRAPSGAKPTIPGTDNSWLDGSKAIGAEYAEDLKQQEENAALEENGPLLASAEDPAVKEGKTLRVTRDLAILEEKWKHCELPQADLHQYLGAVGTIQEIAEDDDTVNLRWDNNETAWIPIQACMDAKEAAATVPTEHKSATESTEHKPDTETTETTETETETHKTE